MEAKTRIEITEKDIVQLLRDAGYSVPDEVCIFKHEFDCDYEVKFPITVEFPTVKA